MRKTEGKFLLDESPQGIQKEAGGNAPGKWMVGRVRPCRGRANFRKDVRPFQGRAGMTPVPGALPPAVLCGPFGAKTRDVLIPELRESSMRNRALTAMKS
jgi:hypothetical protein